MVTTRAQFSYGPHLGARLKLVPEFIGATNRASRRRARIAELDDAIAAVKDERTGVAAQRQRVADARENLDRAQQLGAPGPGLWLFGGQLQGHVHILLLNPALAAAQGSRAGRGRFPGIRSSPRSIGLPPHPAPPKTRK